MYTFHSGGLPNHFDNCYADIASVHKYQTRPASLQKYYLPKMKTSLGQLSLKYIGPKIWSNIPENLKSSPYSFGKQYKSVLLLVSCQNSCWFSFYMLVIFFNIVLMPLFPPIYLYSCSPHPLYIGMLSPTASCCCRFSYFTWHWFDNSLLLFLLLASRLQLNLVYASNRSGWEPDLDGLSPTLCDSPC